MVQSLEFQIDDDKAPTAAIMRISELWDLTDSKLGSVLGLSKLTVSQLHDGNAQLDPATKSFEAARFLLRLFSSLDALLCSDDESVRAWLTTHNLDLDARPVDLLDSSKGLVAVCDYVDAHRARV